MSNKLTKSTNCFHIKDQHFFYLGQHDDNNNYYKINGSNCKQFIELILHEKSLNLAILNMVN